MTVTTFFYLPSTSIFCLCKVWIIYIIKNIFRKTICEQILNSMCVEFFEYSSYIVLICFSGFCYNSLITMSDFDWEENLRTIARLNEAYGDDKFYFPWRVCKRMKREELKKNQL